MPAPVCRGTRSDGRPCRVQLGLGASGLCLHHDPDRGGGSVSPQKRGNATNAARGDRRRPATPGQPKKASGSGAPAPRRKTGRKKGLTAQQERFCQAFAKTGHLTDSYLEAYPRVARASAATLGGRVLKRVEISARVAELRAKIEHEAVVDAAWILKSLRAVAERCMTAVPVLDAEGDPTGEYRFDSAGANRSLELIGKYLGMWTDKLKLSLPDVKNMTDEEIEAAARALGLE